MGRCVREAHEGGEAARAVFRRSAAMWDDGGMAAGGGCCGRWPGSLQAGTKRTGLGI